ncbi:MAG: lytic transglycosylase, partial [Azospira sp.]|nr:lytic transglycosylase [Azospira sp.]
MTLFRLAARSLLLLATSLVAAPALHADPRVLTAREALRAGDHARFDRLAGELRDHELVPWLDYWRLTAGLPDRFDETAAGAFLARHEHSYVAEKLRGDWLKVLGKAGRWAEFDAEFGKLATPDQELSCYALQSRRARGDATMLDAALPLWMSLIEPPEPCLPVLEALIWEKR